MRKRNTRILCFILLFVLVISVVQLPVSAFGATEHDEYLEQVLLGDGSHYGTTKQTKVLKAMDYASYLCVDQFNGYGQSKLDYLRNTAKIPNLPSNISKIDYSGSGNTHRQATHMGWDYEYPKISTASNDNRKDTANWAVRKKILLSTVNTEFDFGKMSGKFGIIAYAKKCNSFAALIYYVHVLGDYMDSADETVQGQLIPLSSETDYNIISELQKHFSILFDDQTKDYNYKQLLSEMQSIGSKASRTSDLEANIEYATELMNLLIKYVPDLLMHEDFFKDVFKGISSAA